MRDNPFDKMVAEPGRYHLPQGCDRTLIANAVHHSTYRLGAERGMYTWRCPNDGEWYCEIFPHQYGYYGRFTNGIESVAPPLFVKHFGKRPKEFFPNEVGSEAATLLTDDIDQRLTIAAEQLADSSTEVERLGAENARLRRDIERCLKTLNEMDDHAKKIHWAKTTLTHMSAPIALWLH